MSAEGSITRWIEDLKAGDQAAAERIWERYFEALVRLARKKLHGAPRQMADEEDIALSALKSLCLGARRGKFPQLLDRDSLWRLLVVITARKAFDQKQFERRQKRGGRTERTPGVTRPNPGGSFDSIDVEQIVSQEPTPEFVALMVEQCQRLLDGLRDDELRTLCLWKMEGYTNDEIAGKLGCVTRTVERKLELIRKNWSALGL